MKNPTIVFLTNYGTSIAEKIQNDKQTMRKSDVLEEDN